MARPAARTSARVSPRPTRLTGCGTGGDSNPRPVPTVADTQSADDAKLQVEESFRRLDRRVHARLGAVTGGVSTFAMSMACADWAGHLSISPGKQLELVWKAARKWQRMNATLFRTITGSDGADPCIEPLPHDRRFSAPEWVRPPFNLIYQSFLLTQQWWHNATTGVPGVSRQSERLVEFASRQWLDMLSPSNFLATNPQVLDRTLATGGANLVRGLGFWAEDAARAMAPGPARPHPEFRPGETVAVTPGKVVYRNRLMELIQYEAQSETVRSVPILIVPAWIMKYYILDLSPDNSFVRWLVSEGFTVFCISWKNPGPEDRDVGLEDYLQLGVMEALDAVTAITGAEKAHMLGYCLGGTLLSIAAAAMARDGDDRIETMTLLAGQVDFSEAGELTLFTSDAQVALVEDMMWEAGYLDQRRMAGAFNMLRSQDLVWSRAIREYLLGERSDPSDIAAWSQDATRMPYRMHSEYLRRLFIGDQLSEGRFEAGGKAVFVPDIRVPVFAVATEHDHIAPWQSVWKLTYLLHGDVSFLLASGGHNTGIVAAPGNPHAHFRLIEHESGAAHDDPDGIMASVPAKGGSWWPVWSEWLVRTSPETRTPPPTGCPDRGYPVIGEAPGTYVFG